MEPTSPKKFGSSAKDFKSRMSFEKHDSYSSKRDRDFEERPHQPSTIPRAPPTAISKYENSNVFNLGRERDVRGSDQRGGRENPSTVSSSRLVIFNELPACYHYFYASTAGPYRKTWGMQRNCPLVTKIGEGY